MNPENSQKFKNYEFLNVNHVDEEASDSHFSNWAEIKELKIEPNDPLENEADNSSLLPVKTKKRGNSRPKTIATCEICGIVLKYPSKIKAHMRTHTGEKPFECDICKQRFTQRTPMINHFREHMMDKPFTCSFGCGKRFVNNARRNAHELRHLGMNRTGPPRPHLKPPRRLVCPSLSDETIRSENLSNSATANFIAPRIDESLIFENSNVPSTSEDQQNKNLTQAEIRKRIDDVIESVLTKCLAPREEEDNPVLIDIKTDNKYRKRQYISRRPTTIAQCTICGLMLKHPSKIAEHVRTHTGEKPFQCGECGLTLTKATSLKVHIRRMHTNYRPYTCEWECGLTFVSVACKREHEKVVHSGLKRYECLIGECCASFSRRSYLMRHRKNVHGDVFAPIFDGVQVTNEEKVDQVPESNDVEPILLYDDNNIDVLMMEQQNGQIVDESFNEDFVAHVLSET